MSARGEIDPDELPLDQGLPEALHEWARVVGALHASSDSANLAQVGPLVSRRGRQLAARVADSIGRQVDYVDPFTGRVAPVHPERTVAVAPPLTAEPAPWGTGLTVAGATGLIVALMMLALTDTLGDTSNWLAFGAAVVLTAGMGPSVWLLRHVLIWRWVALGVAVGLGIGWAGLPFTLA